MKIILLQDVAKVGRRYEVKDLAPGFARNFVLAKGYGVIADRLNLKKLEIWKQQTATETKIQTELLLKNLVDLEKTKITLKAKANPEGHLFASIHREDIATALAAEARLQIDPDWIQLDKPVKQIGDFVIEVKVGEKSNHFTLTVEPLEH